MSKGSTLWSHSALAKAKTARHLRHGTAPLGRYLMPTAKTAYREDPLPDRPMKSRGVTLARVKWLERPMPDTEEEE